MQINQPNPNAPQVFFNEPLRSKPSYSISLAKTVAVVGLAALAYLSTGLVGFFIVIGGAFLHLKLSNRTITQAPVNRPVTTAEFHFTKNSPESLLNQPIQLAQMHTNKAFVYQKLMGPNRIPLEQEVHVTKVEQTPLSDGTIFNNLAPHLVLLESTPFLYPEGDEHWTANFGDSHLFFGCKSGLFAQDELQASEHPAIVHLLPGFERMGPLTKNGSAVLIQGLKRYGNVNTNQIIPRLQKTIYGNAFSQATHWEIDAVLEKFPEPRNSNIFVFVAPNIPANIAGQRYSTDRIYTLFSNAFAAFSTIIQKNPYAIVHTGNWGCGAFGNNPKLVALIQLVAARLAGVKELRYYAMNQGDACREAVDLEKQICERHPHMTPNEFLHFLVNSPECNFLYGRGNGT